MFDFRLKRENKCSIFSLNMECFQHDVLPKKLRNIRKNVTTNFKNAL